MNAMTKAHTVRAMERALATAALGMGAVLLGLAAPAAPAHAALKTTTVGGTTVTVTTLDSHNWSRLSPANADTTELKGGVITTRCWAEKRPAGAGRCAVPTALPHPSWLHSSSSG